MVSLNNYVMCAPLPKVDNDGQLKSLKGITAYVSLVETVAIADAFVAQGVELIRVGEGTKVFVRGDRVNTAWAKEKLRVKIGDKTVELIKIPVTEIEALDEQ